MLPKENRLKGALVFDEVKKKGKMYQSEDFGLLVLERDQSSPSRFGIIVSNKVSKKAVDRNRIKRTLRKAIRENLEKTAKGFDILFLAKKGLVTKKESEVIEQVSKALKSVNIL
jgi:ribonuclease P protein component